MKRSILIVEDNDHSRLLLHDLLTHYGYAVLEAKDGIEGVKMAREKMPELVLMDIQMPRMSGMAAVGILKGDLSTRGLKIIALTSFAMQGDQEKYLAAGFDDYLSKPINTRELPGLVKRWLEGEEQS